MNMKKNVLPEFQSYLRSNSHWASEFLAFSASHSSLSRDLQIQTFFDYLREQKQVADWQVKQADNTVTLYVSKFLDRNESFSHHTHHQEIKTLSGSSDRTGVRSLSLEFLKVGAYCNTPLQSLSE
jgi:hypothetical protein